MNKTFLSLIALAVAAFVLEYFGWWWAMPLVGLLAGWAWKDGRRGFVLGGLAVSLAWGVFIVFYAITSPLGRLLNLFSGILGLDAPLAFVPLLLALIVAFLLGGLGGWTGAWLKEAMQK
jgi:hypothetical protein